ncbi:MAG: hypothetical protein ACRD50_05550 [Candidatus Acidiferrales bacterium]
MSRARKLFILGGLALCIWGMGYGLYYAVFTEHQTLDQIGGALAGSFMRAAERNMPESRAALDVYAASNYVYVRQVDAHGHWIALGMLMIILGIAFDRVEFGERSQYLLALALFAGSVIFPFGVLLETWNHGLAPKAIAAAGAALVILSLAGIAAGFYRAPKSHSE